MSDQACVNRLSEQSKRGKAKLGGVSERSKRCEQTNEANDQVACFKRDCLRLETPPLISFRSLALEALS